MRVLIADDHPIFRAGLKETLLKDKAVISVGEADTGQKVLDLARKHRWDVVILDIAMPGKDGLEVLQELRRERPNLPVLVLSGHPEDQLALRFLMAGAAGYLTKDRAPTVLLDAVKKVAYGGRYVSEAMAEKLVLRLGSEAATPLHENLSHREYQVMRMLAQGKAVNEIAKALFLSDRTVSTYRARVLEKMNLKTNADLIRYALQNKLVD
ncbi:MAG TPA: response regulator transcription factor [Candidatus Binatia bacterium]|jgi:DNA-binding NarL/FixJ family response regulator